MRPRIVIFLSRTERIADGLTISAGTNDETTHCDIPFGEAFGTHSENTQQGRTMRPRILGAPFEKRRHCALSTQVLLTRTEAIRKDRSSKDILNLYHSLSLHHPPCVSLPSRRSATTIRRGGLTGAKVGLMLTPGDVGPRTSLPDEFPQPSQIIAHRPPFLFVDAITALEPGSRATGTWQLRGDEWFFGGHFPGRPTLPGVLMCEAIAQMGAIALLTEPRFAGKLPLFGGLDRARFRRQVVPGDTLELSVELGRMSARAGKGTGKALVGGATACECELMFVLVDA